MSKDEFRDEPIDPFASEDGDDTANAEGETEYGMARHYVHRRPRRKYQTGWRSIEDVWNPAVKPGEALTEIAEAAPSIDEIEQAEEEEQEGPEEPVETEPDEPIGVRPDEPAAPEPVSPQPERIEPHPQPERIEPSPEPEPIEMQKLAFEVPEEAGPAARSVWGRTSRKPRVRRGDSIRPATVPPNGKVAIQEVPATQAPAVDVQPHGGDSRSDLSKLARGGALNFGGAVANGLFSFLFVLLLTRLTGAARAGAFFEAIALFSIVANISQLGGDDGLVRMIPKYRVEGRIRDLRTALGVGLWPILVVGSLLAAVVFEFAGPLSHVFVHGKSGHEAVLASYIRVLAPFIPIAAATTAVFSATRGFGTMTPSVLVDNIGRSVARVPFAAIAIGASLGATALALSWAVPTLVAFLLGLVWLRALLQRTQRGARKRWKAGGQEILPATPRGRVASEFWRFSAPRGLAGVFGITVYWLDTLLVGAYRGTKEAAIYTAAARFLYLGFFALGAIQLVIGPMISGLLTQGDRERARAVYQTATQWLVLASWPVYITIIAFAPFLLRVYGKEFVAGQHVMVILGVAMLISIASGPVMMVLLMSGKSWWTLANSAVAVTLNVVLNMVLIPRLGMEGAAIAWLTSITFNNLAGVVEVKYLLKLTPFGAGFFTVAGASVVCFGLLGLATRQLLGMSLPWFLVFGVVSTGLYAALLFRFRRSLHLGVFMSAVRGRNARAAARSDRVGAMA
jgi:O-antigen/teichoic acid export membrane protein